MIKVFAEALRWVCFAACLLLLGAMAVLPWVCFAACLLLLGAMAVLPWWVQEARRLEEEDHDPLGGYYGATDGEDRK